MRKIENPTWTAEKIVEMVAAKVGVIVSYDGERFDVERARENGYGAIEIFNYRGECHGLDYGQQVEILGTFNLD